MKEEKNENKKKKIIDVQEYEERKQDKFVEEKKETVISISKKDLIMCLIIIVGICSIFLGSSLYNSFRNKKTNNHNNDNKIELKYTETSDKVKEGVYITDVSEVVANAMPSIVSITSKTLVSSGYFGSNFFSQNQYTEGAGSGIIIAQTDTDLMLLTNNHVVENAEELSVQFINEKSYDAKIVGTSEKRDIAIIKVSLNDLDKETLEAIKIATIGDSEELNVGNGIIAIGNALGYGQSVTTGVVSALNRKVTIDNNTSKMIQIDAAINGGNSGGALLNNKGEVVGINSAKYSSSGMSSSASIEGMGFAIPISNVKDLITSLMNGEADDSDVTIGIAGYIINDNYSKTYNLPAGFYISEIVSGSGADKAKLEIGNIITKIEDKDIEEMGDIQSVLFEHKKGDKIKVTVKYASGREYKEKEVVVTLS